MLPNLPIFLSFFSYEMYCERYKTSYKYRKNKKTPSSLLLYCIRCKHLYSSVIESMIRCACAVYNLASELNHCIFSQGPSRDAAISCLPQNLTIFPAKRSTYYNSDVSIQKKKQCQIDFSGSRTGKTIKKSCLKFAKQVNKNKSHKRTEGNVRRLTYINQIKVEEKTENDDD